MSIATRYLLPGLLLMPAVVFAQPEAGNAGWISVVPPLLAIALALIFRQVIPALFLGLLAGAWAVNGLDFAGFWSGLLDTMQVYVLGAAADEDHVSVILFSTMIGGMVGIIQRNGGMQGVVNHIAAWANSAKHACMATATMGLAIFFDDYANTLVVGNTMRPVTDRFNVSREKLAYIVDSTAAPVSCLALVTTWIGYQVGLIDEALKQVGAGDLEGYALFLESIPYAFYPILAIIFVFMVTGTGRDFGPMLAAERRARHTGVVESAPTEAGEVSIDEQPIVPIEDKPHRAINAALPVLILVLAVLIGLLVTGGGDDKSLRQILNDANAYQALVWASLLGVMSAAVLSLLQGVLTLKQTVDAWYLGARSMAYAMIILILAWSLSSIAEALGTADFLVSILGDKLHPGVVPTLVFVLAAATAFATGSSWGTMGILMPLVMPLVWVIVGANNGLDASNGPIVYSTIACVLAGAVWGDHCSPISDTTILSSMASGCDHIQHVRTQLPYAMSVGIVAIFVGTLPVGFGMPWWLALVVSIALLFGLLKVAGQRAEETADA